MKNALDDFFENGNQSYVMQSERSSILALLHEDSRTKKYEVLEYVLEKLSIDDVRIIQSQVALRAPTEKQRIVFIGAGTVSEEAMQSLLKLLEEPPVGTRILFAITQVKLPQTIYSRVFLLKPCIPSISENASDFLNKELRARLETIVSLTKESKNPDASRIEIVSILKAVIEVLRTRATNNPATTLQSLKDIDAISRVLETRGAPTKMLLEHLALTL